MAVLFAVQLSAVCDATYRNIVSEYTLLPDGGIKQHVKKVLVYNTHHSFFKLFGETFVVFDSETQSVKIDTSYTVQKDGTYIGTPANAFNYVLPSVAAKAPDYNKLTELVITHTGLEVGATSCLEYTVTTQPGVYNSLDIEEIIGVEGADIDKYQVIVNVPDGVSLRWSLSGSKVKPVVENGKYIWTFKGIESCKGEAYTPYGLNDRPCLSVTTSASLAENLIPLTVETMDICRVPENYLKGADNDEKRAASIQNYVVNGLASCNVAPYMTGNRVRQCSRVMETAYGTEAEKALALVKLMRSEGLDAQAVVAFPADQEVKTVRNVAEYFVFCNKMFYSVRKSGVPDLMWRASRYDIYDLAGNKIDINAVSAEISYKANIDISASKAVVDGEYVINPGCSVFKTEKNSVKSETSLTDNNGYMVYTLPAVVPHCVDTWNMNRLSKERTASLEIPYPVDETFEYVITLNGVQSVMKTGEKSIENSVGCVKLTVNEDAGRIIVKRHICLKNVKVPVSRYKDFLALMHAWYDTKYRKIIFRNNK